jgi:indole-3-glycerol phosphate synthase
MSADLLQTIVAAARRAADVRASHAEAPSPPEHTGEARPSAFEDGLRLTGTRVIAECKRRSPSRGVLRADYDPAAIALQYELSGAAAISVLTEPTFFGGSLDHLRAVRDAVAIPLLRKDFIVTDFQIDESVDAGADAVLLIVGALTPAELGRLVDRAARAGLAALVEVHDGDELSVAVDAGARIIGVNSRNLRTLDVDVGVFDDLAPRLPAEVIAVAESGLRNGSDLARLGALGYRGFLIGERFMTEASPGAALAAIIAGAERAR